MNQFSENILATYIQTYGWAGPISYTITLTMFPLLNAPGTCLTLKLEGMVLIEWQHLKEGRPLFEKRGIIYKKRLHFMHVSFQITIDKYHYDYNLKYSVNTRYIIFYNLYVYSMFILIYLWLNYGLIPNKFRTFNSSAY